MFVKVIWRCLTDERNCQAKAIQEAQSVNRKTCFSLLSLRRRQRINWCLTRVNALVRRNSECTDRLSCAAVYFQVSATRSLSSRKSRVFSLVLQPVTSLRCYSCRGGKQCGISFSTTSNDQRIVSGNELDDTCSVRSMNKPDIVDWTSEFLDKHRREWWDNSKCNALGYLSKFSTTVLLQWGPLQWTSCTTITSIHWVVVRIEPLCHRW